MLAYLFKIIFQSEDEVKPVKNVTKKPAGKAAPKKKADSDDDSEPVAKKSPQKKPKKAESDDDEEEVVKPQNGDKKPAASSEEGHNELFIKNLGYKTNEDGLSNFFSTYGTVTKVKILYNKEDGRSKGIGFVEFESNEQAKAALDDAANLNLDGRYF